MRTTLVRHPPAARAAPLTPLERSCVREFRSAIAHLHDLLARLARPSPNIAACRQDLEAIVGQTGSLGGRMVAELMSQGLRADPRVRQLICRCSELAARVHRTLQRAQNTARQAQVGADLFSQERLSPPP